MQTRPRTSRIADLTGASSRPLLRCSRSGESTRREPRRGDPCLPGGLKKNPATTRAVLWKGLMSGSSSQARRSSDGPRASPTTSCQRSWGGLRGEGNLRALESCRPGATEPDEQGDPRRIEEIGKPAPEAPRGRAPPRGAGAAGVETSGRRCDGGCAIIEEAAARRRPLARAPRSIAEATPSLVEPRTPQRDSRRRPSFVGAVPRRRALR